LIFGARGRGRTGTVVSNRGILSGSLASTPGYSLLVYGAIQLVFQRLKKRDHMPEFDANRSGSLSRGSYLLLG
jgi:hypothetical protein